MILANGGEARQGQTPDCSYHCKKNNKKNKSSRLRPNTQGFEFYAKEFSFLLKRRKPAKIFLLKSCDFQSFEFHGPEKFHTHTFFFLFLQIEIGL